MAERRLSVNRIVLIGFRGAGKTTIARQLADCLNWRYISTDEQVEHYAGRRIKQLVEQEGWQMFRQMEHAIINRVSREQQAVIDCGGGVVEDPENMRLLSRSSLIVWVDADISDLYQRLKSQNDRPLLSEQDLKSDIDLHYRDRESLYGHYGQIYVNTSRESTEAICQKILQTQEK